MRRLAWVLLLCWLTVWVDGISTFNLTSVNSQGSSLTNSTLQVDSQGRTFVIAGNQLLRLSRDLQLEQNVSLTDRAATFSLSPDEQRLFVCVNGMTDRSCFLYSPSDLTVPPVATGVSITGTGEASATSFATEGSFYVGSYDVVATSNSVGQMQLSQYIYGDGTGTPMIRTDDYEATESGFSRTMLYGFVHGEYAYFVTADGGNSQTANYRILRVCHTTTCPGNTSPCPFTALYEQAIPCGNRFGSVGGEYLCGLSLVEDFSDVSGPGVIVSRCRLERSSDNIVCSFNLTAIDENMDVRYDRCSMNIGEARLAWTDPVSCRSSDFTNRCNFVPPLDDTSNSQQDSLQIIPGSTLVNNVISNGDFVTASLAIQVDGLSIIVVAYSSSTRTSHSIAFYKSVNNERLDVGDHYKEDSVPSAVGTLQWHNGLGFIYATSSSTVIRVPLEECSLNRECFSCVSDRNPLCGWCVVENKCSRVSQCANGNSTSDRWIRADSTTSSSGRCITNVITPNQYVMDNPEILSVSVDGPGLPAVLPGETYSCHLSDSQGRYNIIVPAVTVEEGRNYTCNITNANFNYVGVESDINFSFISSRGMVPFDTTANALTIYRCSSASRCTECLRTENACGWCSVNKICRGTPSDCIISSSSATFLQLMSAQSFDDVCPLLLDTSNGYSQHVRVGTDLQLTTSNLPPIETGFSYMCDIGGTSVPAMRNSDTAITCDVNMNQLTVSSMSNEVVNLAVIWTNGASITHRIDTLSPVNVTLYDCMFSNTDCSACVNTRVGTSFQCGWCEATPSCSVLEECTMSIITEGRQCPAPTITSFSPQSGPPRGGTVITIMGRNLGVVFSDFTENSITLRMAPSTTIACTPISDGYVSGATVRCRTNPLAPGMYSVVVELTRASGQVQGIAPVNFAVLTPTVSGASPLFGPIAGGTELTITGTNLDIGNSAVVRLNGISGVCREQFKNDTVIVCSTPSAPSVSSNIDIVVTIDSHTITIPDNTVQFSFRDNPTFTSVQPQSTILSGGTMLTFIGTNLDVAQNPQLLVNGLASDCMALNSTILRCITPLIMAGTTIVSYVLRLDDAPSPNTTIPALTVMALPDPEVEGFTPDEVPFDTLSNSATLLTIQGRNFLSVDREEIRILVGGVKCTINRVVSTEIDCIVPENPEQDNDQTAAVRVSFGANINFTLPNRLKLSTNPGTDIALIGGIVAGVVVLLLVLCSVLICAIILVSRKQSKKKELQYTNLIARMELLEVEMADECKRAFTELQTDLADLVQISDKNLPYRDFRTFAMRFLFPKAGLDHPVLCPLVVEGVKMEKDAVMKQLQAFQQLLLDKKFLLVFIRTLEGEGSFTLQDKCNVASLLMVIFQNDLDYATDILQTLLAELMRKTIAKSHPKLLLRRTESVGEKMLANWLAFLLFPYILEHVGEPLFILFRAIKSQLEKGPVDVVTGEAKNSLSEEKLLRTHLEFKPVEGVVQHEDEEVAIKFWDCDSITQAKEKVLDALYRNTPVSKRPQLQEIDLELISRGENGIVLRDQDATNRKEGEWVRINTLGHFNLEEMSKLHDENPKNPIPKFRVVRRDPTPMSANYDTLGTIIANMSVDDRCSRNMSASELSSLYHLVKPDTDDAEGTGGTKIVSEVFLTRLLSTKRILQPYVDKLFQSIFAIPHGRALPKAIKSLFDFLDLQASELGITDSEVLHSWKTNSVPLRFWVNVIKNPDFVFDIHKSATVDSCLTVIAQAYIDATSTADIMYTKDTPSARLLYVNEVKEYKNSVTSYYNSVQSLPKLSNSEMAEYLRDTTQVCAESVSKDEVEAKPNNDDPDPALMTRRLYFVTESALFELFKVVSQYSDEVIDALNEEGLALLATSFDQIRKSIS